MTSGCLRKTMYILNLTIFTVLLSTCVGEDLPDAEVRVNRLSEQVLAVLDHYKREDPVGLPGVPIPDPMPIPEVKTGIGLGNKLTMKDQSIYGLSKFKIESVSTNFVDMETFIAVRVDILQVLGNYTITTWLSTTEGASNTTLTGLYAEGIATLEVAREGHLEATDVNMDLTVTDIDIYFENPGLMGSILQGAMNSIGTIIFDAIKPYIISQVNKNILGDVNKNLRSLKTTFPNSLPPFDVGVAEARKFVRLKGYDPFKVDDLNHATGIIGLKVSHIWVTGLSSFHRVGNITVDMENNTIYLAASVGTQQLGGKCQWELSMAGLVSTVGNVDFVIEYIEVDVKVNQTLDVRNRPNLEDLVVTLGNFQLQFDGAGTADYVIEAVVNILPNLLRHHIMVAVKEPLKMKVQEVLNDIDVEKTIKDQVAEFENMDGDLNSNQTTPREEGLTVDESQLDDDIF